MGELKEVDWQAMLDGSDNTPEAPPAPVDPAPAPVLPIGGGNRSTDCEARAAAARLEACGVFVRYHDATFETIEARGVPAELRSQVDAVRRYAVAIDDNVRQGAGLLLRGPVGTMKTTLAVAVLQCWLRRDARPGF